MTAQAVPYGRVTQKKPAVAEIHIIWITAGLGCDGDSVSITAATQPSIEDVLLGAIPGLPKVHLHNPVLAYEVGDDFLKPFYQAEEGKLDPFVLVVEGSIPNEKIHSDKAGYWAAMGTDTTTGQPIKTTEWIDRLAPKALAAVAIGTCATYGGIHAMQGNPTGCMGLADYLGWEWRSKAGVPIVNVPGCPVQPDNFMETVLYLLYQVAGHGSDDSAGRSTAPDLVIWSYRSRRLRSRRLLRAGRLRQRVRFAQVHREAGLLGPGSQLQCSQTRMDGRYWRLPQCWRHLHWLHHARFPRQVHAIHGRTAGSACFQWSFGHVRARRPGAAFDYSSYGQQGTEVAAHPGRTYYWLSRKILISR